MREFFRRLRLRFVWSWAGVVDAWVHQHSFRTWVWAYGVTLVPAFLLPLTAGLTIE